MTEISLVQGKNKHNKGGVNAARTNKIPKSNYTFLKLQDFTKFVRSSAPSP
jgi:hypothetical protein